MDKLATQISNDNLLVKIHPGDIVVTSKRKFDAGSLPIRFANFAKRGYSGRTWTHVAMYIGGDEVVEAFPGGVVKNKFSERYLNDQYDLVILRRITSAEQNYDKAVNFLKTEIGNKYDFRALVYFVVVNILPPYLKFITDSKMLDRCLDTENAYFCSELVGFALMEDREYCFDRAPHKVMPVDYYNDLCFQKIAEIRDPENPSRLKKVLVSIAYGVALALWTLLMIAAAVGAFALLVWIWNYIVRFKESKKSSSPDANATLPKHEQTNPK